MNNTQKKQSWKYKEIIAILGEENIERMYFLIGNEKLSFATILHFIRDEKIDIALKEGVSPNKIASITGVSKMTVYRHLNSKIKKVTI